MHICPKNRRKIRPFEVRDESRSERPISASCDENMVAVHDLVLEYGSISAKRMRRSRKFHEIGYCTSSAIQHSNQSILFISCWVVVLTFGVYGGGGLVNKL